MSKQQLSNILNDTSLTERQKANVIKAYESKLPAVAEKLAIKELVGKDVDLNKVIEQLRGA